MSPKSKTKLKDIKLEHLLILNIVLFSVVAIMHFLRFVLGIPVYVGSFELPLWLSGAAVIVLVFMIWQNWVKTKKNKITCAKILLGIFTIDLIGVLYAWYYNIEFFGFAGTTYIYALILDVAIVSGLYWYIARN